VVDRVLTKYSVAKKKGKSGAIYRSPRIYLPTKLTDDSTFPFKEEEEVLVRISARRLIVEKVPKKLREEAKEEVEIGQ
jgi:hypothetical protein